MHQNTCDRGQWLHKFGTIFSASQKPMLMQLGIDGQAAEIEANMFTFGIP